MKRTHSTGEATVDGRILEAIVDGVVQCSGYFEDRVRSLLAASGLDRHPESGTAYDFGRYVDLLERIERTTGPNTLARVGHGVAQTLHWPHQVGNVDEALETLDTRHRSAHASTVGGYTFEQVDDTSGRLHSTTPYPAAFERGLVTGLGERFGDGSGYVNIKNVTGRKTSEKTFELAWWTDVEKRMETVIPAPSDASDSPVSAAGANTGARPASGD